MNKNKRIFYAIVVTILSVCLLAATYNNSNTTNKKEHALQETEKTEIKKVSKMIETNVNSTKENSQKNEENQEKELVLKDKYAICSLNIRTHVGVDSELYTTVPINTKLSVVEDFNMDGWVRIMYDEKELYVNGKYLSDNPVEVPEPEPVVSTYANDDFYIMSHVIMAEAGGESWEHMIGVGSVVLNRVNHDAFPNTIKDVVYQKGQYACMWDGNYEKTPNEQSEQAARYLLENGSQMPSNVVWQAEFVQGNGIYKQIGNTYFCYK